MRTVVMSSGLLAFGMVIALSLPAPRSGTAPEAAKPVAFDANPADAERKVAYARNLPYEQKAEAVAMLRDAARNSTSPAR